MASSFMGLYVQRDGLNLAQKALDITGSNITNVKTPGYTRQRLDIVSTKNDNRTLGYVNQVFLAGAGADGKGVTQIRDELLDNQFRKYSSITSGLTVKQNVLSDVEDAIDDIENDESGFASALKNFKSAFQSFSANGTDQSDLASVAQNQAQTMIDVLRTFSNRIDSVSEDVISDAKSTVSRVNDILEQCAKLNEQIKYSYVNMNNIYESGTRVIADTTYGPLELKDSMNNLIDELSNYMKVSVKTEEDGTFTISLPNEAKTTLVKLDKYAKMDIATDPAKVTVDTVQDETGKDVLDITIPDPEPGELKFQFSELRTAKSWKNVRCEYKGTDADQQQLADQINTCIERGEYKNAKILEEKLIANGAGADYKAIFNSKDAVISDGTIRADQQMYNGAGVYADTKNPADYTDELYGRLYQGVPFYKETFNQLAVSIAKEFNSIYEANGYNFKMFDFKAGLENTAEGLKIADDWLNDPLKCVHPNGTDKGDYDWDEISNEYINKILGVMDLPHKIGKETLNYSFEDFVAHYGNTIGSQLESIKKESESGGIMYDSVQDARDEVMGVNSDEEGINMLNYQKWYNAMARMVTAMDSLLDKLINGTGTVGL